MGSSNAIVDDALAAYAAYLRAFNARDAASAAAFYATPTIVASPAGRRVLGARAEVEAMLARSLARLATMDFSATRIVRHAAHAMHDDAVLLSAEFLRERADGSPIESVACTYVLSRDADGWRVVTMIAHPPQAVLPAD